MAVKAKTKAAGQAASGKASGGIKLLHDHLIARAPQEDLAGYQPADLESAVAIAHEDGLRPPAGNQRRSTSAPSRASRPTGGRCR